MKAIALQRKTFFISISLWCILTTDAQGHLIIIGKGSDLFRLNTHFLLFFGDLDKSFSLDNAHASMALRSLNHDFIVHEALVLVLRLLYALVTGHGVLFHLKN